MDVNNWGLGSGVVSHRVDILWVVEGLFLTILAVDPGEEHVGYALFYHNEVIYAEVGPPDRVVEWAWQRIESNEFETVVAEAWRNYDNKPVTWSECRTAEVIGALRYMCTRHGVEFVTQPASIKRPALGRMGFNRLEMPSLKYIPAKDRIHVQDAIKHGYWYHFEKGLIPV